MKKGAFILLLCSNAISATVYVTVGGNDTTGNGSVGNPYATCTKAASVAVAGDTINVGAGMYQERVTVPTSGTVGNPITYLGNSATNRGFLISNKNYITIQGFSINNTNLMGTNNFNSSGASGIFANQGCNTINIISNYVFQCGQVGIYLSSTYAAGVSSNCLVQGNVSVSNNLAGIILSGINNTASQNEVSWTFETSQAYSDAGLYKTNLGLSLDSDGILWYGSGLYFASNNIHDIYYGATGPGGSNYWYDPHADAFQGDSTGGMGVPSNCVFHANIVNTPKQNGAAFYSQNIYGIQWYNNIVYAHRGLSINVGTNLTFVNNTVSDDLADPTANPAAVGLVSVTNFTIENNIFFNNPSQQITLVSCTEMTSGTNIEYMTSGTLATDANYDAAARLRDYWGTNPVMVAQSAPFDPDNYALTINSPAVDAGIAQTGIVTNDCVGVQRPFRSYWDIGAYEFIGHANIITGGSVLRNAVLQ